MPEPRKHVLVWDWTIRLFHWLILLGVATMWWTAEQGMMDWHRRVGLGLLGLLAYRLVWGLIGPRTARLYRLVPSPRSLMSYGRDLLARRHTPHAGHNPVGSLSVIAMLLALATQVTTGLFSVDVDGLESGPLATKVSFETGRFLADIHETSFNVLLALIVLHVAAIAAYLIFFRDNLVRPMLTGRRSGSDFAPDVPADARAPWLRVLISAVLAFAAVGAVWNIGN
ncbi:MAG: cytochrome b/b6 domain-containing protein [Alphaproteobacteria bacterium]|nr:cytochrome b/b6 domain-containing protein [Alphaproteobacteria bacterium]MBU2082689.1 cytochrome b/b6 domain-containing protein [Alphaproteobacteria bacterium]MBU2142214.1 cytochrome b/b6 domain-containing protein [Alphaproteobacteria bacterium]MBU2196743.1 cytochrome b/b6 domain-containing protein [Alphaproteobacteria bacterium]